MADLDKVKDRIRKLLNVAENDAASQGEIDNAVRAARNMMHAYNLQEDDCKLKDEVPDRKGTSTGSTNGAKVTLWQVRLSQVVCDLVGGVACYQNNGGKSRVVAGRYKTFGCFTFYGREDLAILAAQTYEELCSTIATMGKLKFGGWARTEGAVYCEGFVQGLRDQIKEADRLAQQTETGTALVVKSTALIEQQRKDARQWLATEKGIKLVKGSRRTGGSGSTSTFDQGRKDGRATDLNSAKAANTRKIAQ